MHKFENIRNFRDLGECTPVQKGLVFRSGNLAQVTEEELSRLAKLGISTVIDLRVDREAASQPDRLPTEVTLVHIPLLLNGGTPGHTAVTRIRNKTAGPPKADMIEGYFDMASQYAPAFGQALAVVAEAEGAVLFHCQHGKDRTGVFAALLLSLAGATKAEILADYLRTNDALAPFFEGDFTPKSAGMDDAQKEVMKSVFTAEPDYLEAFFGGIAKLAPTPEEYAAKTVGVSQQVLDRLVRKLRA